MYIIRGQVPSKSNCYKVIKKCGHASLAKQKVLKEYEKSFFLQCPERDRKLKGYFELHVKVFYRSNLPDLDNALKILLDCLQMTKTIDNDRYCTKIIAEKFVDKENPRVEYIIIPVGVSDGPLFE